jgi:hypothetical protein
MSTLVTNAIKHGASGSNNVELDSSGNLKFNSGYGSPSVAYGCRAWVNFNGTSTVAIRASGNVSSITDNGVGDYTVNFTTAMPDTNYALASSGANVTATNVEVVWANTILTTSVRVITGLGDGNTTSSGSQVDGDVVFLSVFR